MIKIRKSPTADTRSCDVSKVTKDQLKESSEQHISDVDRGLAFFEWKLRQAAERHDYDKLSNIDHFYSDFQNNFKTTGWWDNHRKIHRHHLAQEDGIPEDVNLLDILEYIVDCVMAGMARTGTIYEIKMSDELLRRAFLNTIELLKNNVEVIE